MDKQSKDKKNTPQAQKGEKAFQRSGNEAAVKGELAIRGKSAKEHQQKNRQHSNNNKQPSR